MAIGYTNRFKCPSAGLLDLFEHTADSTLDRLGVDFPFFATGVRFSPWTPRAGNEVEVSPGRLPLLR